MRRFRRLPKGYRYGIILGVPFLLLVVLMYLAEAPHQGEGFDPLDAFAMTLFLLGGEVAGHEPISEWGRLLRILTFLLGVGLVAVVIGNVAAFFMRRKTEVRMRSDTEGHIVICGWNSRGDKIVREIHAPDAEPDIRICIITDKWVRTANNKDKEKFDAEPAEKQLREAAPVEYENVYFVSHDPTNHSILKQQRAHRARSVIILMNENSSDPDGETALIALAISNLEESAKSDYKPHMVAEVKNHRKMQHLKDAGVDEIVCANDFGLGILAQAALTHEISGVYRHLLSHEGDTNEIYLINPGQYPDDWVNKSYCEVANKITTSCSSKDPVILLGVKREAMPGAKGKEELFINPRQNEIDRIHEKDILIVMAYKRPNLTG